MKTESQKTQKLSSKKCEKCGNKRKKSAVTHSNRLFTHWNE